MSRSVDDIQQQVKEFTDKVNESLEMARALIDKRMANFEGDVPEEVKEKIKEFKAKIREHGNST